MTLAPKPPAPPLDPGSLPWPAAPTPPTAVTVTDLTPAGTLNVCSLPVEEKIQVVVLPLVVQVGSALASVGASIIGAAARARAARAPSALGRLRPRSARSLRARRRLGRPSRCGKKRLVIQTTPFCYAPAHTRQVRTETTRPTDTPVPPPIRSTGASRGRRPQAASVRGGGSRRISWPPRRPRGGA